MDRWNIRLQSTNKAPPSLSANGSNAMTMNGNTNTNSHIITSTVEDHSILDFGTSVNVNEDLRRAIKIEIQEIDESIVAARGAQKNEEAVEAQLNKDLAHSHREMKNLSRGATEQLETSTVHSSVLSSLQTTLEVELEATNSSPSAAPGTEENRGVPPEEDGHGISTTGISNSPSGVGGSEVSEMETRAERQQGNQELLQKMSNKFKEVALALKTTAEDIDKLITQQKSVSEKTEMISKSIETESLPTLLEKKRQNVATMQAELDKEKQRKKAMKAATQKSRENSGVHAQAVADKTKELDSLQRETLAAEKEFSQKIVHAQMQLSERRKARAAAESEFNNLASQLAYCKEVEEQLIRFKEVRNTQIEKMKLASTENEELLRIKAHLESQLQTSTKELENNKERLQAVKKVAMNVENFRIANDELENTVIIPGKQEMVQLLKEKEQLAKTISDCHEESLVLQERRKEEIKMEKDKLKASSLDVESAKETLQEKILKRQQLEQTRKESCENWERETNEHIALEEKYRLAYEAESKHNSDTHNLRKEERDKKLEEQRHSSELRCASMDRRWHILIYGAETIKQATEIERELNEEPDISMISNIE